MNRIATWTALMLAAAPALSQEPAAQHRNPASEKWQDPRVLWQEERRVAGWLHIDLGSAPYAADLTNQQAINQAAVIQIVVSCTGMAQYAKDVDAALHACEWNQIRPPHGPETPPD